MPRVIERNAAQSPDPNNIHQQDIWSSRGSGASVASPRIGLPRRLRARSLAARKRHRVCSDAAPDSRGKAGQRRKLLVFGGICCERLAKIPAKKRINVTGREKDGERDREKRAACLFSCRITVAEIISRCSLVPRRA